MGSSSQAKKARRIIRNWETPEGMAAETAKEFLSVIVSEVTTLTPKQIKRAFKVASRKT